MEIVNFRYRKIKDTISYINDSIREFDFKLLQSNSIFANNHFSVAEIINILLHIYPIVLENLVFRLLQNNSIIVYHHFSVAERINIMLHVSLRPLRQRIENDILNFLRDTFSFSAIYWFTLHRLTIAKIIFVILKMLQLL